LTSLQACIVSFEADFSAMLFSLRSDTHVLTTLIILRDLSVAETLLFSRASRGFAAGVLVRFITLIPCLYIFCLILLDGLRKKTKDGSHFRGSYPSITACAVNHSFRRQFPAAAFERGYKCGRPLQ
jgi:hypothetical protein